jgi:hypothetical protein
MRRISIRRALPAGVSAIAMMTGAKEAGAEIFTFDYSGATVLWTVPQTGLYDIAAFGAQGGGFTGAAVHFGGKGAEAGGDIALTAGQELTILVGGQGGSGRGAGGGGGSFVTAGSGFTANQGLLLAAGGGGGFRGGKFEGKNPGQTTTAGQNGFGNNSATGEYCFASSAGGAPGAFGGSGGTNGGGGGSVPCASGYGGGGGAGVKGAGSGGGKYLVFPADPGFAGTADDGAPSITSFGKGIGSGGAGGFGGGGGGVYMQAGGYTIASGGGGGGYSGGGGGGESEGGGGGSFVNPLLANPILLAGVRPNNGQVIIDAPFIADVLEPSTSGLLAAGFAGLGFLDLRRGRKGEPPQG